MFFENVDAEGQCHEVGQEDAGNAKHLFQKCRRRGFYGLATKARRIIKLVAVETRGTRQERPDKATDQERAKDVLEGKLDPLSAKQYDPAIHRSQDPDELHASREANK